jgi:hypothetical protein
MHCCNGRGFEFGYDLDVYDDGICQGDFSAHKCERDDGSFLDDGGCMRSMRFEPCALLPLPCHPDGAFRATLEHQKSRPAQYQDSLRVQCRRGQRTPHGQSHGQAADAYQNAFRTTVEFWAHQFFGSRW